MKIIIAGGTGFIGSALVNALLPEKHEIIVLSRAPEKIKLAHPAIQLVKWDGKTGDGWARYADGADALVNLAGEPIAPLPWFGERKIKIRASRVNAGYALADAALQAKNKPRALVQASAVGYYGLRGDERLNEDAPPGDDYLAQVCRAWEAATLAVEAQGVRRAVYRTGLVLARHGGILPLMALPFQFFVGGRVGDGKQWMSWIHLADEIAAIKTLIQNENARGAFNLVAPNPVRNQTFARALAQALGRPSVIPTPAFALKAPFGEMADLLLLGGQRVAPQRLAQLGFQFRFPTIEAALQDVYRK